jgi:hypothetical protein
VLLLPLLLLMALPLLMMRYAAIAAVRPSRTP